MSAHWREWRKAGAPRLLVQWLRNGVPLKWRGPAPRGSEGQKMGEQDRETQGELKALLRSGAFERGEAAVISPTFLIPKKDGSQRLIHDLRAVNKHLDPPHFTLRGARDAGEVTRNAEWLAVLDLCHGYQQVAMAPAARKFLGAWMGGEMLVSTVLPFGLSLSPYVFTRITNWLAREIRRRFGLQTAVYIDDFLLGAESKERLEQGIEEVKGFFETLGVVVSAKKEIRPVRVVEFIGFEWDACGKTVGVPKERRREYRRAVKNLLRGRQSRDTWRRVIGKLGFLREAVGQTMRHVRSLLHVVNARKNGARLVEPGDEAREDLRWWSEKLQGEAKLSLRVQPVTAAITTDASDGALGFLLSEDTEPRRKERCVPASREEAHINVKEIEAVLRALEENRSNLRGKHVVWYSDSMTAIAAVRNQGTQKLSRGAWEVTKQVLDLADEEGIRILPKHVPGRLNGAADSLSRPEEHKAEWERVVEKVTREWGPLQDDPCGALGEPTCLLESWEWAGRRTLLLPEVWRIGEVVQHLSQCAAGALPDGESAIWPQAAVVITPLWRGATWWPRLVEMRVAYLRLGRLEAPGLQGWFLRNGHWPEWTASLVPLVIPSGLRGQGRSTNKHCCGSSAGRSQGESGGREALVCRG